MTTTKDAIREHAKWTADFLRVPGRWAQGVIARDRDRDCITTALVYGGAEHTLVVGVERRVARVLGIPVSKDSCSASPMIGAIQAWNDAPERTAAEVITVLERVAAGEGASIVP